MQAALWLLRSLIIASFRQCSFDGTRTQNKFSQYHKPLEIVDRGPLQLRQQPIQIGSAIMQNSGAAGIEAQIGTWALHRLGAYRSQGSFAGADRAFARALALPLSTATTESEIDRVCEVLTRYVSD